MIHGFKLALSIDYQLNQYHRQVGIVIDPERTHHADNNAVVGIFCERREYARLEL
jgi:hypothetical protein